MRAYQAAENYSLCESVILLFWFGTAITRGQRISAGIDIGGATRRTFEVVRAGIAIALGTLPVEHFNLVF